MTAKRIPAQHNDALFHELRSLIEETRSTVATTVNAALTMLYWRVGKRISKELLQEERAAYGAEILPTLSAKLLRDFGRGWSERNLAYMVRLAETFPDGDILQALSAKLSWSHFLSLIPPENYFLSHAKPRSREEKEKRKNEREREKGVKMELHYIVFSCEVVPKAVQKNSFFAFFAASRESSFV